MSASNKTDAHKILVHPHFAQNLPFNMKTSVFGGFFLGYLSFFLCLAIPSTATAIEIRNPDTVPQPVLEKLQKNTQQRDKTVKTTDIKKRRGGKNRWFSSALPLKTIRFACTVPWQKKRQTDSKQSKKGNITKNGSDGLEITKGADKR